MSATRINGQIWDADRLRMATTAAGCALWSWNVATDEVELDYRARGLWWVADEGTTTFKELSRRIDPEDLGRVKAAFIRTRDTPGPYEIDFRIRRGGETRWISARGQGEDGGIVDDTVLAVFMDVTQRKSAEEARELLAGEMSHRVKNLFAVASALTAISARSAATTGEMARDIVQRLTALSDAHDLVRPMPGQAADGAALGDLLTVLLAPFGDMGGPADRIRISVPEIRIGEAASTALALIIHELATNSIKHGALSVPAGTLDISCEAGEQPMLTLEWLECGGPAIDAPPQAKGFGGKLVSRSVSGQFEGTVLFDWRRTGVMVTLTLNRERLAK